MTQPAEAAQPFGSSGSGAHTGVTSLAVGNAHALALKADGTVLGWGTGSAAEVPADLSGVKAIAAGGNYSLALIDDGTLVNWGSQTMLDHSDGVWVKRELDGRPPAWVTDVTAIAIAIGSSGCHLALRTDGTVVSWVPDDRDHFDVPHGLTGVVAVSAGNSWCAAVQRDTTVRVWGGQHYFGQDEVPYGLTGVTAVAVGNTCCLALRSDGSLVAWGGFPSGHGSVTKAHVPAGLADVTQIAVAGDYCLALKASGTVVGWGYDEFDELAVPAEVTDVVHLTAAERC